MYGTVARLQVKDGEVEQLKQLSESVSRRPAGAIAQYALQSDDDPNEVYLFVIFEDESSYRANAASPESHSYFLEMMKSLEAEPEWHDGEIVFNKTF